MTFHFECSAAGWQHHESEAWGTCRRFIEVLDDQQASRQIDVYNDGRVLVYDRRRPRDSYGMLIGLQFSRKPKWQKLFTNVRLLSASDFESAWHLFSPRAIQRAAADGH